jgi:hypothetical protein
MEASRAGSAFWPCVDCVSRWVNKITARTSEFQSRNETYCKQPSRLVRPKTPPASPRLAITNQTTSFSRNQSKGLPDLRMVRPSSRKNMLCPIKCIPTARQPSLILLKFHQLLKRTQRDNKTQQSKPIYLHLWSHNLELGRVQKR